MCPRGSAGGAGAAGAALSRRSLSSRWLERNLPVYGSQAAAILQPQLELLWAKSGEVALYVSERCSSLLSWIHDSLPWFTEWVRRVSQLPGEARNAGAGACEAEEPVSGVPAGWQRRGQEVGGEACTWRKATSLSLLLPRPSAPSPPVLGEGGPAAGL